MGAGPDWVQDPMAGKVILGGPRSQGESEHGVKGGQSSPHPNLEGEKSAEIQPQGPGWQGGALSPLPCTLPSSNGGTPGQAQMVGSLELRDSLAPSAGCNPDEETYKRKLAP